jgi:hypothetical protein
LDLTEICPDHIALNSKLLLVELNP